MKRTIIFLFLLLAWMNDTNAQHYITIQNGQASLIINFSGEYPKEKNFSLAQCYSYIEAATPIAIEEINDSTYILSFYTLGPSSCSFYYDNTYYTTILIPNQVDILDIHYFDTSKYTTSYKGHFKEMFNHSEDIYRLISQSFASNHFIQDKETAYTTANAYRDDILNRIQNLTDSLSKGVTSPFVKHFFRMFAQNFFINTLLFDQYQNMSKSYTGLEKAPTRDISFYEGIVTNNYADTSSLIANNYMLLSNIYRDSLLGFPLISNNHPQIYTKRLNDLFGSVFPNENNLFYDMVVAVAYMDHINKGQPLSNKDKHHVLSFFKNKHISTYILYKNELNNRGTQSVGLHYLPFDKSKDEVLEDILSRYVGKVVVIDFWATWCGPCLAAFEEIKEVKERLISRDDVVFVYITNESSNYSKWKSYVDLLGGEHYYLYNNQDAVIGKEYDISSIPSYLIFNKKGELTEKNLGGYMGNKMLMDWINDAL